MKNGKPEIIVTNDDGYFAKGINSIANLLKEYGNVTVVAPQSPQSGKSGSLTLGAPLLLDKLREEAGFRIFSLTGTPVDCVKMAVRILRNEGKTPDLLISGINHGSNASASSVYSGTLGAATEGALYDIPSIGLSINTHDEDADFTGVLHYSRIILDNFFKSGIARGTYLNINFPDAPLGEIKGMRMAHQGAGRWVREFEVEIGPDGRENFLMKGMFEDMEQSYDSRLPMQGDHRLLIDNYISIVPHKVDRTDYDEAARLSELWKCDIM